MHSYDGGLGSREFYDGDSSFIDGNSDSIEATPYEILGSSQGGSPPQADTPLSVNEFGVKAETEDLEEEIEADVKKDQSTAVIHYEDRRDSTLNDAAWTQLDAFINGPDWSATSRVWINLPTIRREYDQHILRGFWDLIQQRRCEAESDLIRQLRRDIHQLHRHGWTTPPANVVQGEFMRTAELLSQIYPGMIAAANSSDLPRMQELINVGYHLLGALQVLVDVEKSAREDINKASQ
jgi:hypothetical protein